VRFSCSKIIAFFALIFAGFSCFASAVVYIDSCSSSNWSDGFFNYEESYYNFTDGGYYVLTNDLEAKWIAHEPSYTHNFTQYQNVSACIYFRNDDNGPASNVTLDCDGHSITESDALPSPDFAGVFAPYNGTKGGNITIKNCVFSGFHYLSRAIEIGAPNVAVENCTFIDNSQGIQSRNSSYPRLTRNTTIANSTFSSTREYITYGILMANSSSVSVQNSSFTNVSYGIYLGTYTNGIYERSDNLDQCGLLIEDSNFSANRYGIVCVDCASRALPALESEIMFITNNYFDNESVTGIYFSNVSGGNSSQISNNTIRNARSAAINLVNSRGNQFEDNLLAFNGLDVFGTKGYSNLFKRNIFYFNRESGFVHFLVPGSENKIINGDLYPNLGLEYRITQPMKDSDAFSSDAIASTEINARLELNQETDLAVKDGSDCSISLLRPPDSENEKSSEHLTLACPGNNSLYFVKSANQFAGFISMPFSIWFSDGAYATGFDDRNFVAGQYAFFVESPSIYEGTTLEGTRTIKPNSNYRETTEAYYLNDSEIGGSLGENNIISLSKSYDSAAETEAKFDFAGARIAEYPQSVASVVKSISLGLWHWLSQAPAYVGFQRIFTADHEYDFNCSANASSSEYNYTACTANASNWTGTWTSDYVDSPKFMGIKASYNSSGLSFADGQIGIKASKAGQLNSSYANVTYQFLDTPFLKSISFNGESMDSNIGRLHLLAATSYITDVVNSRVFYATRPDLTGYVAINLTQPFEYSYTVTHSKYEFPEVEENPKLGQPFLFSPYYSETDLFSSPESWETENCTDYTGIVPAVWPDCFYNKSNSSDGMSYSLLVKAGSVHKINFKGSPVVGAVSANVSTMAPTQSAVEANWTLSDSVYLMRNATITLYSPGGLLEQEDLSSSTYNETSANGSHTFAAALFSTTGLYTITLWANDSKEFEDSENAYVLIPETGNCKAEFEISAPESASFYGKSGSISVTVSNEGNCERRARLTETHSPGLSVLMDKSDLDLKGGESETISVSLSAGAYSTYSITFRVSGAPAEPKTTTVSFEEEKRVAPSGETAPKNQEKQSQGNGKENKNEEEKAKPLPTAKSIKQSKSLPTIPAPTKRARGEINLEAGSKDIFSGGIIGLLDALTLKGICDNGIGACWMVALITAALCGGLVYFSLRHEIERRTGKGLRKRIAWLTEKNSWYLVAAATLFPILPSLLIGCCEVSGYFFMDATVCVALAIYLFLPGEEVF